MKLDHKKSAAMRPPFTQERMTAIARMVGATEEEAASLYHMAKIAYDAGVKAGYDTAVEEAKELLGVDV